MEKRDMGLLESIADLHEIPAGAYNIRKNGEGHSRRSTANIEIVSKSDKPGIDIIVAPGTKNESVHIPVIITEAGVNDLVYNDFYIGDDADVLIVAGCGIHNSGELKSEHNGIHSFHIGKKAKAKKNQSRKNYKHNFNPALYQKSVYKHNRGCAYKAVGEKGITNQSEAEKSGNYKDYSCGNIESFFHELSSSQRV